MVLFSGKDESKWTAKIPTESILDIEGVVVKLENPTAATQSDVEVQVSKIFVVARATTQLPFQVIDAGRSEAEITKLEAQEKSVVRVGSCFTQCKNVLLLIIVRGIFFILCRSFSTQVGLDTRLDHRHLDLRTPVSQAIARISSAVCTYFREYLLSQDFVEIQTPKLLGKFF